MVFGPLLALGVVARPRPPDLLVLLFHPDEESAEAARAGGKGRADVSREDWARALFPNRALLPGLRQLLAPSFVFDTRCSERCAVFVPDAPWKPRRRRPAS